MSSPLSAPLRSRATRRRAADSTLVLLFTGFCLAIGVGCQSDNDSGDGSSTGSVSSGVGTIGMMPTTALSCTSGITGTAFSVTCNATVTAAESVIWDFGDGTTEPGSLTGGSKTHVYAGTGTFTITLTGTNSFGTAQASQEVTDITGSLPIALLSCTPNGGLVSFDVECQVSAANADTAILYWGDGSDPTPNNVGSKIRSHTYEKPGGFLIRLIATNRFGDTGAYAPITASQVTFTATSSGPNAPEPEGPPPLDITFAARFTSNSKPGQFDRTTYSWTLDGEEIGTGDTLTYTFLKSGDFEVIGRVEWCQINSFGTCGRILTQEQSLAVKVFFDPVEAAFSTSVSEGPGPLEVQLLDESIGAVDRWTWNFGDGTGCVFPPPDPLPELPPIGDPMIQPCDAASPTHTYDAIGHYDVTLTAAGPDTDMGPPSAVSNTETLNDAVHVFILDPSFEEQTPLADLQYWQALDAPNRPANAKHTALTGTDVVAGGDEPGMPTDGEQWARLTGQGTLGDTDVDLIENGIRQEFMFPSGRPVLEFDYVLLYSEPPASSTLDAMTATVQLGSEIREITSAQASVASAYAGLSARNPMPDGNSARMTPVRTASIHLADEFAGSTDESRFTLTIRTSNAQDGFRSPFVYVDAIRFREPSAPITAQFAIDRDSMGTSLGPWEVLVGQDVQFVNETCVPPAPTEADPDPDCIEPFSWRWDFDSQTLSVAPPSSGSAQRSPSYIFTDAGDFDVRLTAGLADSASESTETIRVISPPDASLFIDPEVLYTVPALVDVVYTAQPNSEDPIASCDWDLAGWTSPTGATGCQSKQVAIGQAGTWTIRVTVTTQKGQTETDEATVVVEP